ncbi:MAG: GDP-mannose 4,6-dehydratase, partial [Planctomycetaceae bacterium]|nr:GDP-mannose 4,6-dehydratase [Planctomycetaceae bacterium]
MDSYLVTGGAGFIGSTFVKALVADGDHVVNLDKLTYAGEGGNLEGWRDNPLHILVVGDIADKELVRELLDQHQPRYVVNFAAESHVDRSIDDPVPFLQSNVTGCVHLLEQVRKYWDHLPAPRRSAFRYLQVSTDEVYGTLGAAGCFVETTAYAPNSPYAASKAAADHFVRAYHRTFGVPTLTTHSTNNYGPFQHVEKLIPRVIVNALTGRPIPVYGDGLHVRDWL